MGEEFYSIIKLTSGEEIFSLVSVDENDGDPVVILQNPVTMKMLHGNQGIRIKVKPWIELSQEDFFMIKHDRIITMTETKDERLIGIYNNFISDDDDKIEIHSPNGKIKPSAQMGYIASVKDAKEKLEKLFNLKES
jgi:hypothetical protein